MLPVIQRLTDLPAALAAEQINVLAEGTRFKFQHILSGDCVSPPGFWYDQTESEWAILLSGRAELEFSDNGFATSRLLLHAGDAILIPAHLKHRIVSSNAAVWLALHCAAMDRSAAG